MEQLALTLGIGITAFLVLYFVFLWNEKEHIFLRILGAFFFVGFLVLMSKSQLDFKQPCEFVVNQTTVTGNVTTYDYDYLCATEENSTAKRFHNLVMRFVYVFGFYVFMYFIYAWLLKRNEKFAQWMKKLEMRRNRK